MNDIVPREQLVKRGTKALGGIGGGIGLLFLKGISTGAGAFSLPGVIVGGIIGLIGLGISSSKEDRKAGLLTTLAGGLTVVASLPIIGGIANALMTVSGIGLLAAGGYSLYKFIRGIKSRS